MTKGYKAEREVTSEKIRVLINMAWCDRPKNEYIAINRWSRRFKRRLPESKGWVRGYAAGTNYAVALSDKTDTELIKVYICDGTADEECKKLGVLEVMFADD